MSNVSSNSITDSSVNQNMIEAVYFNPEPTAMISASPQAPSADMHNPYTPMGGYPAPTDGYPAPMDGYSAPVGGYPIPVGGYPIPAGGYPALMGGYPVPTGQNIMQDTMLAREVGKEMIKSAGYCERKQLEIEADRQKDLNRTRAAIARDKRTVRAICDDDEIVLLSLNEEDKDKLGRISRPHTVEMLVKEDDPAEKILAIEFLKESGKSNWYLLHQSNWDYAGIRKAFLIGCGKSFHNAKSGVKRQGYEALLGLLISIAEKNEKVIPVSYGWQGSGTELRRVVRGQDQIWKEVRAKCK